jgi:hypothetical protein
VEFKIGDEGTIGQAGETGTPFGEGDGESSPSSHCSGQKVAHSGFPGGIVKMRAIFFLFLA